MPEGDTLARIADGLRPALEGQAVTAARARVPGPKVQAIVGRTVVEVVAVGKNLIIRFDNGLELRTHLRLRGTWHRYRPREPWRRAPGRATLVLEVPGTVAVAFDVPTVQLYESRAAHLHPALGGLGPDLLDPGFDPDAARQRLRGPAYQSVEIGVALVDQRALAGIGNVVKSETLFLEGVDPFATVGDLDDASLDRLIATAARILRESATRRRGPPRVTTRDPATGRALAPGALWVYRRAGRPCHRCGTRIRSMAQGSDLPRTTYWCPSCQSQPATEARHRRRRPRNSIRGRAGTAVGDGTMDPMRVSARSDYALRAVVELAAAGGGPIKREDLATAQSIPLDFLEHVLLELKHVGIVMSQRGSAGGFRLARPASEISLADVIRAVEGPMANVRGQRPEAIDYPGPAASLKDVWIAVRASLRDILESTSVEDVVSGNLPEHVRALTQMPDAYRSLGRVRGPTRVEVN